MKALAAADTDADADVSIDNRRFFARLFSLFWSCKKPALVFFLHFLQHFEAYDPDLEGIGRIDRWKNEIKVCFELKRGSFSLPSWIGVHFECGFLIFKKAQS